MIDLDAVRRDLERAVAEVPVAELPELAGLLEAAKVRVMVRLATPAAVPAPSSELLTAAELAAALRVPETAVRAWGRANRIPVEHLGRFRRYRLPDVRRALGQDERGGLGITKSTKKNGGIQTPITSHLPVNPGSVTRDGGNP